VDPKNCNTDTGDFAVDILVVPIPEPGSLGPLSLGLALIGINLWVRRGAAFPAQGLERRRFRAFQRSPGGFGQNAKKS
jgi:hypothetical protein